MKYLPLPKAFEDVRSALEQQGLTLDMAEVTR